MQASQQSKVRRTPFGASGFWSARANPCDVVAGERTFSRRPRPLSAAKLSRVQPELARLGLGPEMLLNCGHRPEHMEDRHRGIGRTTWSVVRLAVAELTAQVLHAAHVLQAADVLQKPRRISRVDLPARRRRP